MAISMDLVKKLRDLTNAGMMDCKKSLETTNGDLDAALKLLKEKGLADAKKRSDRETKEGGVFIKKQDNKIAMAKIGCETDFVAKNNIFIKAKDQILDKILETGKEDLDIYKALVEDAVGQIKENIELKSVKLLEIKNNQFAATYIHGNNKIGVTAIFDLKDNKVTSNAKFIEFTNNICLHIAANSPYYLTSSDIPQKEVDEQKEIFAKQMENEKKPKEVLEKIITGKIAKYFSEICLIDQKYVKDDKMTIKKYIEAVSKELGTEINITKFVRLMIG
jgi:elongation factor Ts